MDIKIIFRIIDVLKFKEMNSTLKGPCVKGLIIWKLGQKAIDGAVDAGYGFRTFQWLEIGELHSKSEFISEPDSAIDSALPQSMFNSRGEWHNWLFQVSSSTSGVTPALEIRMPQDRTQESDDALILKFCKDVHLSYPHLGPEEAVKKAFKLLRATARTQATWDPTDVDLS